jgi:hypothetical protein
LAAAHGAGQEAASVTRHFLTGLPGPKQAVLAEELAARLRLADKAYKLTEHAEHEWTDCCRLALEAAFAAATAGFGFVIEEARHARLEELAVERADRAAQPPPQSQSQVLQAKTPEQRAATAQAEARAREAAHPSPPRVPEQVEASRDPSFYATPPAPAPPASGMWWYLEAHGVPDNKAGAYQQRGWKPTRLQGVWCRKALGEKAAEENKWAKENGAAKVIQKATEAP